MAGMKGLGLTDTQFHLVLHKVHPVVPRRRRLPFDFETRLHWRMGFWPFSLSFDEQRNTIQS